MLNPFNWLRQKSAEAIVMGTADGLRAVAPEGESPPANLAELRALLSQAVQPPKALAAARTDEVEPEPAKAARKK